MPIPTTLPVLSIYITTDVSAALSGGPIKAVNAMLPELKRVLDTNSIEEERD